MTKTSFISEVLNDKGQTISARTNVTGKESLSELLEEFELFLRGAGFYFDGKVEIVAEQTTPTGGEE